VIDADDSDESQGRTDDDGAENVATDAEDEGEQEVRAAEQGDVEEQEEDEFRAEEEDVEEEEEEHDVASAKVTRSKRVVNAIEGDELNL
jgi:hypothetical protein